MTICQVYLEMAYQQCRYKGHVKKIPIQQIDGQACILLNDVRDRFPAVQYFTYNNKPIPFEHDNSHVRLKPLRIKANIEIIIDCHKPMHDVKVNSEFDDDSKQQILEMRYDIKQIRENTEILKKKADAILRQTFELAEFTVPRLFIVLPEYT